MSKKNLLFSLVLMLFITHINAQSNNKKLFYVDSYLTTSNENNFEYIKEIEDYDSKKNEYKVKIYYKSGQIYLIGTTTDKDRVKFEGKCLYYFENGKKRRVANYVEDRPFGKQFYYHENGVFKAETEVVLSKDKKNATTKIINYYDENNVQKVINGEGEYLEDDYRNKATSKGMVREALKEGLWHGEMKAQKATFTEQYSKGKLVEGVSIDSLSNKFIYTEIEERAHPRKGFNSFYNYLKNNSLVPKTIEGEIQGQIILNLYISDTGKITKVATYNEDKLGITANAIQLISQYENWIPGKHRGITVKTHFTLPITFK
ncbi:energy transducer TonB [Flavobacterium sp. TSSA_36]|uniref:energy transducer TonB n=1 Tax=Flavobacterium sp. TSSA_36 TaxID=3447669 RepID=UPI003F2AE47C